MMDTERKAAHFIEAIEAASWAQLEGVAVEVGDEHREKTDRVREEAERRAREYLDAELSAIERRTRQALDARRAEHRRELAALCRQFSDETLEAARERIRAFTASPAYPAHLAALAKRALAALGGGDGAVVCLRREDMRCADLIKKSVRGVSFTVEAGNVALGGLTARTADGSRRADLRFETALSDAWQALAGAYLTEGRELSHDRTTEG